MSALGTALAFARNGLGVFPVWWPVETNGRFSCACGTDCGVSKAKHPIARLGKGGPLIAPNGVNSATTDTGIIKNWWRLAPEANLGVSTANLVVLDVDPRHGGLESLNELSAQGEMPPTWSVKTGSGGQHIYYRRPEGLELKLPLIATTIIKNGGTPPFGPGIDVPAYVIAPPSRHICGRTYEWDDHPSDYALAEAPGWIVDRLTKAERRSAVERGTPTVWERQDSAVTEYRDAAVARIAGKLLRAVSLPTPLVLDLVQAWNAAYCRPPLHPVEVSKIFDRLARKELERLEMEDAT